MKAQILFHRLIYMKLLILSGVLIICTPGSTQSYTNKGTDFWVGYGVQGTMYNADGSVNYTDGGSQEMVLYFTSIKPANVRVEIPATGWVRTYAIGGNGYAESDPIPKTGIDDARLAAEGVSDKGIHITSDIPIGAFAHIYDKSGSALALLIPTNILGQDYYTLNFTQTSTDKNANSFGFVLATEDSTTVEITPSVNTLTHPAGVPFTQMLQKGQIYNLLGTVTGQNGGIYTGGDLTGTHIRTIVTANAPCKKIAVFAGSGNTAVSCTPGGATTSDNMMQQMYPGESWGNRYVTVPTFKMPNNYFRVMVKDPATIVNVNGTQLINLINGRYYEFQSDTPCVINSDLDIMVAQYITTSTQCNNTNNGIDGDPDMIYLVPMDQDIIFARSVSTPHYATTSHYINVIMSTFDTAAFQLDGIFRGGSFTPVLKNPNLSYAQFKVDAGGHTLISDSSFNAIAYGYGPDESYGYDIGFSFNRLTNFLSVQNPYGSPNNIPQTCRATQFKMAVNLVFQPTELVWDFLGNPNLSPNNIVDIKNAVPDSVFNYKGQTYYRYTLPGIYNYSTIGPLDLKVYTYSPTQDGCTSLFTIDYDVDVVEHPVANWSLNYNKCANDTLYFKDSSSAFSNKTIQWIWDFGDGTGSADINPVKKYAAYGDYNVALRTITDIGCFADTVKPVSLTPYPVPDFSTTPKCEGIPTNFTDLSTISYGAISTWHWNFGDGTVADVQNTLKMFPVGGPYFITLTVSNKNSCTADTTKLLYIYKYPRISASDTFVYQGNSVQLKPAYTGDSLTFKWTPPTYLNSDTAAYPVSSPQDDILYHLTVTGPGGCATPKDIFVDVIQILHIPNAFSPNGDGINDKWIITNLEYYPTADVEVFNRYGQPLFYSTNYAQKPWDGTYNGSPVPVGTYYYIINAKSKYVSRKSGYVVVLR